MGVNLAKYDLLIFDCDGVILNSNSLKAHAFYRSALIYGEDNARELLAFHNENGGVSRVPKFKHFLNEIVKEHHQIVRQEAMDLLLERYAAYVSEGLSLCSLSPALPVLKQRCKEGSKWAVVSGGDQGELRNAFTERCIDGYFDAGIYGSPDDKDTIIDKNLLFSSSDSVLFVGDSRYDYEVASRFGMDFVFLYGWTGMPEWTYFCSENNITHFESLSDLVCSV